MTDKEKSSGRWWEYYFIRYSFGTVIGAALIFLLADSIEPLKKLMSTVLADPKNVGTKDLTILAASGFVYCYVASAPMLALHAMRIQLFAILDTKPAQRSHNTDELLGVEFSWIFAILPATLVLALLAGLSYLFSQNWHRSLLGLISFSLVVFCQMTLILSAHRDDFIKIRRFYRRLTNARSSEKSEEYVESYRHMREHSNAYSIIILELLLAPSLIVAQNLLELGLITAIWLLPAGYCWLLGTLLEIDFAYSPKFQALSKSSQE